MGPVRIFVYFYHDIANIGQNTFMSYKKNLWRLHRNKNEFLKRINIGYLFY